MKISELTEKYNNGLNKFGEELNVFHTFLVFKRRYLNAQKQLLLGEEKVNKNIEELKAKLLSSVQGRFTANNITTFEQAYAFIEKYTAEITQYLESYKADIKQYYVENNLPVYHITSKEFDKLIKSKNALSQFEVEMGEWVFATSREPSKNTYRLRAPSSGMHGFSATETIYFGNHLFEKDGKLKIKTPQYMYTLSNEKFSPVVTIVRGEKGYSVCFDDEWTSEQEILKQDMLKVEKYDEVTDILFNKQIFSTTDKQTIEELRQTNSSDEKRKIVQAGVQAGVVVHWNTILDIKPDENYIFENNKTVG